MEKILCYFFFSSFAPSAGFGDGTLNDSGRPFSPSPTISHGLVASKLLDNHLTSASFIPQLHHEYCFLPERLSELKRFIHHTFLFLIIANLRITLNKMMYARTRAKRSAIGFFVKIKRKEKTPSLTVSGKSFRNGCPSKPEWGGEGGIIN